MNYAEYHKEIESLIAFVIMIAIRLIVYQLVWRRFNKAGFQFARRRVVKRVADFFGVVVLVVVIIVVWQVDGGQVFTYLASIFTVLGVALFAQWSLLSNLTSGIFLYFNHPVKLGDSVDIFAADTLVASGIVEDITYFFIHIRNEEQQLVIISNTEFIQKITKVKQK